MAWESVALSDGDALAAALERLPGKLGDLSVEDALLRTAKIPVRRAKRSNYGFKDRSGQLRKSIRTRRGARQYRPSAFVWAGNEHAFYAYWVEHGHGGPIPAKPHPYAVPAIEETQDQMFEAFTADMRIVYRRVVQEILGVAKLRTRTVRALTEGLV